MRAHKKVDKKMTLPIFKIQNPLHLIPIENWRPNSNNCERCLQPFGYIFNRPHHCRVCGYCVCHACSVHEVQLEEEETVRVCDYCVENRVNLIAVSDEGNEEDVVLLSERSKFKIEIEFSNRKDSSARLKDSGVPVFVCFVF
eukprot:TRINITY_DN3754_c0_g1_i1.p1 TRINITY_DN3754_c0_g1~~TRINITY_DN3754_c0_g1_i1.p1  ORF type:complete len:142 (-),score=25.16 TRINITY_DN3754_c0_g1_i1:297-722(-)